jgi:succinate dehydrogenase/fumarate reductase flavoprotein subunit
MENQARSETRPGKSVVFEVDVVVVGSGAGGMATALVAASEGLRVVILEKAACLGGTTALSGGGIWIPANSFMRAAGDRETQSDALTYLRGILGGAREPSHLQAFIDNGSKALDYFQAHSDLRFTTRGRSPDYYPNQLGATKTSRAVDNQEMNGLEIGDDFNLIRSPRSESLIFSGLPVNGLDVFHLLHCLRSGRSFKHVTGLLWNYILGLLRHGKSKRLILGRAIIGRMIKSLRRLDVDLEPATVVRELIQEEGRVIGLVAQRQGKPVTYLARRGVVLATGGFGYNPVMRARWTPHPESHFAVGAESNQGDGIRLGLSAGGVMPADERDSAYWVPVSVHRSSNGAMATFPHLVTDRAKPGVIAVDGRARRFVNEAVSYHDFVRAMFDGAERDLTIPAYLVCDHRALRRYGLGLARPWPFSKAKLLADGYLIAGSTVLELAKKLGIDGKSLAQTVNRYNDDARCGEDSEFCKGSSDYDRHMGDALHRPNPCLAPLDMGPFYAVTLFPGNLGTSRGLTIDGHARVLDRDTRPIVGLYAVGSDADSVFGGAYPGPGASLGPALTFGYLAGMHLATKSG